MGLQFFTDPSAFLDVAGDHLAADPVVSTVVASVSHHAAAQLAEGIAQPERNWWLAVRDDDGAVIGAAMRTAPFVPYPMYVLPMPDEAAVDLARALHERGEEVLGVNGALPAARVCADELARLRGGRVEVEVHTRLFEVTEVTPPKPAPGRLVPATEDDVDLARAWFEAFSDDADEQAGRPRGSSAHDLPDRAELLRSIRAGDLWLWLDEAGRRVHLTGTRTPAFGVTRIGPVYTPPQERGHGWASNAVAEVSRRVLAQGVRVCLFTDQANPTSNKVYIALGYRPVVDMANLVIVG